MITTVVTVTSTFLAGSFGAAAVAALILFLIMRELTSAHAEESGSVRSKVRSAAPRVRSPRGFSWVRSGEPAGCRTREEFPEADGVRLRVVGSMLQRATSVRGDVTNRGPL